jgi:hypothetical protein
MRHPNLEVLGARRARARLGGGSATSRRFNFDRHWRNIRTLCNHNPAFLRGRVLGDFYLNDTRDDFDEGRVF